MAVIICAAMWFGSCQNEELDYYPLEKKGENLECSFTFY